MNGRAWRMAAQTLLGLGRRGVFVPYRYAASLPQPPDPAAVGYPAIEALLRAHEPPFAEVLAAIAADAPRLAAMNGPAPAPRLVQAWFARLDAGAAMAMVRRHRPRRIVEVGSGHSTRFLAAAVRDGGLGTEVLCIDPQPRATLPEGVAHRAELLAPSHAALFAALQPGDMAFFDGSHLMLPHGDVDLMLNHMFPVIPAGVLVHVHDIFLPDPYPAAWTWRAYAEQSALGGWLLGGAFRPLFSSHWAATRMPLPPAVAALPLAPGALESSLWLVRH